ncbi:MAG: FG-GAP-like repeat-containing protein [Bacteroidota bacterium]
MDHKNILLLFCILLTQTLSAQSYTFSPHAFGANLFAGGLETPRYQFIDIDGDHDPDLFILDLDDRLWFYRNSSGTLVLEPGVTFGISAGSWFHFVDIDHDGDNDCMTNGAASEVSLYTNIGTATAPQFFLDIPAFHDTSGGELFSERFSIPTFADIDGDGDDDFFTGSSIGSITLYKNVGTPFSPKFAFVTSEFGGINIQGGPGLKKEMHGASSIEFFDADSNGVLDLFWGDLFNPSLYYLKNNGTNQIPNITLVDSTYPNEAIILTKGFNIPQHVDMDQDGFIDLMIGSVYPSAGKENFHFLKNIGTNIEPFYLEQTKNFIPMIDAGSRSTITAADMDIDGDLDLIVSSGTGVIHIYPNIGTAAQPVYQSQPAVVLPVNDLLYAAVSSGDVNGDGKPDLVIGSFNGILRTYLNTTAGETISFVSALHALDAFTFGQNSAPCVADIDGNGTLDVLVGDSGGKLTLLKNTGTNALPHYQIDPLLTPIDIGNDAIPFVGDLEMDGVLDLLIGDREGRIHHFQQTQSDAPTFELVTHQFKDINLATQAAPCLIDIDSDGDNDLLLGNGKGGLFLYCSDQITYRSEETVNPPVDIILGKNYPNPFNPATTIPFYLPSDSFVSLRIFDILGRGVKTLISGSMSAGKHSVIWNASGSPSGVYFCRLNVTNGNRRRVLTHRLLLVQ